MPEDELDEEEGPDEELEDEDAVLELGPATLEEVVTDAIVTPPEFVPVPMRI